jgi:hypothetical protein
MMYQVVCKDIEEKIGYIYPKKYTNKKEANEYIKVLRQNLAEDYYDIFVADVSE